LFLEPLWQNQKVREIMTDTTINKPRRFSRRMLTLFWSALIAVITITLLAYERVDVLYILATIALIVLLAVVATSDLEGKTRTKS
jgi:choline-glycine betaine transporter